MFVKYTSKKRKKNFVSMCDKFTFYVYFFLSFNDLTFKWKTCVIQD